MTSTPQNQITLVALLRSWMDEPEAKQAQDAESRKTGAQKREG